MDFKETIDTISSVLSNIGSTVDEDKYDGIIVKKLESSNTLDKGRTTKQSHIAITGGQMDMFPYVRADGYFEVDYDKEDQDLKKYFVAQIPVVLHKENVDYLDSDASLFTEEERLVHVSIVRGRRNGAADQVQMSMTYMDSPEFVEYRRIVHAGSYMILLKRKSELKYDIYSVKENDITFNGESLQSLNNCFVKLPTNTVVPLDEILTSSDDNISNNDDYSDVLSHNLFGIHMKAENDALSEERPHVCIGWSEMGDLSAISDKASLSDLYEMYYHKNNRGKGQDVGQIWRFINDVKIGDYIIYSESSRCHIGRVDSGYIYDETDYPNQSADYVNVKKVTWLKKDIDRSILSENINNSLSTGMSLWAMNDYKSVVVDILQGTYKKEDSSAVEDDYIPPTYVTGILESVEKNRIVFGAPGTGKSWLLQRDSEELVKNVGGEVERVTFHPDYTYSQFVGTYKPVSDANGDIRYEFVAGPFMRVFVKAILSGRNLKAEPYILLIEEINRAKVAAVFGDVFQLLDRDEDGVSEYEIQTSQDVRNYLSSELGGNPDQWDRIKLPDNMLIWATMNSADQGVFPMDTAFKRRWSFEYLGINDNQKGVVGKIELAGEIIEWNKLRKAINDKLAKDYKVNEDKLMGPYFLAKKLLKVDDQGMLVDPEKFIKTFKSKVIMYLYEDAAKQHKHKLFSGCADNTKYSSVCEELDKIGIKIFGEDFKATYYDQQKE